MFKKFLIEKNFYENEFIFDELNQIDEIYYNSKCKSIYYQNDNSSSKSDTQCVIENINESNYYVEHNDIKYKLFKDITSIHSDNNDLNIILNIPSKHNIVSINKIKLSANINKYVKYINIHYNNNNQIISKNFTNSKIKILDDIKNIMDFPHTEINICVTLDKKALNHVINKNIFVNYSYAILKNKMKFL
jgi:hypothetical protein